MNKIQKVTVSGLAGLLATATLAACGSSSDSSDGATDSATKTDFLPCMVSDAGGFDDHSFNELGYDGLKKAAEELGSDERHVESSADTDYAPNIDNLVSEGCDLIITVGFNLASATKDAAKANPDVKFVLIDDAADGGDDGNTYDGKADQPNIKPLLYNTAQAAFLAGYASASYSKAGIVGTYGGMNFPTVSIFMDGFAQGVDYYNAQKGKTVKVVGWDEEKQDGAFTGGFEANNKATQTAQQIIDQGADVILPVGGPIYQGALTVIKNNPDKGIVMLGVDADVFETDPTTDDYILTSVEKKIDTGVYSVVKDAAENPDSFDFTPYIGTLENDGVGIAPFHNYEDKVDSGLADELDTIKAGIIDGSIPVKSYLD
ncbi:MAG: BMP family ABC transporter substrate-binding protein [Nocardioides sp.]|uniref:BMP family lipoprotein n=1 Tax=Nocardioides sp. TaxID=35761 RepID=UPI0039E44192